MKTENSKEKAREEEKPVKIRDLKEKSQKRENEERSRKDYEE